MAKPKAVSATAEAETQTFKAVFNIFASAGEAEAGDPISLTRDEYDELKPVGAIEGEWVDTKPAEQAQPGPSA